MEPLSKRHGDLHRMSHPFTSEEFAPMRTMFTTMLGLGLAAAIAAPAAAQQGRGFGMMMGGGNLAMLLVNTGVTKELKLDDQQTEKAKELADKTREKMQENREATQGLEGEERFRKMQELNHELSAATNPKVAEILKPEQLTRLKEISCQVRGASAFSDPEIVKKLNLTDSQKSDIEGIVRESMTEMRSIFQDSGDDREAAMKKVAELRKQTLTKAESKLSDEQQKTWKGMLGAPYEFRPDPPRNN
jgi:Spy/CpxP family protein refolding chaperone